MLFRSDTHTLRLKSELFDLRVGYANPILRLGESQRGVREPLTVAKEEGYAARGKDCDNRPASV